MKTSTILLGLLLAAGALASLPNAQAMQAPPIVVCVTEPCPPIIVCIREPCPGPVGVPDNCDLEAATPAEVRTTVWGTDEGCDADVEYYSICAPPSHTNVERTIGPVHVFLSLCDGGVTLPDIASTSMQPPIYCVMAPCGPTPVNPYCTLEQATPGTNPYTTVNLREEVWGTDTGCDVDVEGPAMICAPPSSTGVDRTVGPVHVDAAVCDGGIPDRIGPIICCLIATTDSAAMQPPIYCVMAPCGPCTCPPPTVSWCTVKSVTPAEVRTTVWGTDYGCDVDVDTTYLYQCAPPSGQVVERTVGPVHAKILVCDGGIGDIVRPT